MIQAFLFCIYGIVIAAFALAGWRLHRNTALFSRRSLMTAARTVDELPSVSVCIPARNESHAMTDSLQRVLASTYPKLEIIVMDDVSRDKTPAIIKAFAQEGVRFIEGKSLPKGWLGKNHALNTLLKEASGTYVLFLDVDTQLTPDAIEQLVTYAQQHQASMVSVMPRRPQAIRASTVFAPLRYLWELLFHSPSSPAVASSAWMIHRQDFIRDFVDFEKLKAVIQPEAHIAATYMATQRYRFLIGSQLLGISYEKKWRSQVDTSIRLLFPLLGSRMIAVIVTTLDLLIVSTPLFIGIGAVIAGNLLHAIIAVLLYLFGAVVYSSFLRAIWSRGWVLGSLLWPVVCIQEAILIIISAVRYRQGSITWKGRPIQLAEKKSVLPPED